MQLREERLGKPCLAWFDKKTVSSAALWVLGRRPLLYRRLRSSFSCVLPISSGIPARWLGFTRATPTRGIALRTHDEDLGISAALTPDRRQDKGKRREGMAIGMALSDLE